MLELHVPDMSCGHCKKAIQGAVHAVDPSARVDFDMESRHVKVESSTDSGVLIDAVTEAGYSATAV